MTSWLSKQAESFYEDSIQNLIIRYGKYLNKLGNYAEK